MINVLLAVNLNQVDAFLDNWRFDADGNRLANDFAPFNAGGERSTTIDVYNNNHCYVSKSAQGLWKTDTSDAQANKHKQLITIYVADIVEPDWTGATDPDPKDILTVLHYLRETFAGNITVVGAWQKNGLPHGQTLELVDNGTTTPVENQDHVITMVDEQVVDIDATIADGTQIVYKTVQKEVVTYVGNGTFTDMPNYDEVIPGKITYPILGWASRKEFMPDDVTYDNDGNEISRAPASIDKEVNQACGWKNRRWS